jgi:hypothetical protein
MLHPLYHRFIHKVHGKTVDCKSVEQGLRTDNSVGTDAYRFCLYLRNNNNNISKQPHTSE